MLTSSLETKSDPLQTAALTSVPGAHASSQASLSGDARRQIRILHVLGSMDPGGVESWLLNLLKYIDRDIFQFDFCTCGTSAGLYANEIEALGGKLLRCPKARNLWSFRRRFRKILREGQYDVLHSHVYLFSGVLLRWATSEGIPIRIAHSHTSRDDKVVTQARHYYQVLMKSWINRYATRGLAVSEAAAAELFGNDSKVRRRVNILPCGIDLSAFQDPLDTSEIRKEIGLPLDASVVGHVANFIPVKNHSFLLDVATQILKTQTNVHFLLVGDGPLRAQIQAEATVRGLINRMHFVGTRTDVPRLMRGAMDFYLFPSRNEGLGVSVLEAQAAGLKCLVSDSIPREVSRFPGSVEFLPLSAGVDRWTQQVILRLSETCSRHPLALDKSVRDPISIHESVRDLTGIYLGSASGHHA